MDEEKKAISLSPEQNENLKKLKEPLVNVYGKKCVEKTRASDTRKGYNTTGYNQPYLLDRLNEVIGIDNWSCDSQILSEEKTTTKKGGYRWEATCKVYLSVYGIVRSNYGGSLNAERGDALKGAFTNAFKKTCALFDLGNDAMMGVLDEDLRRYEEGQTISSDKKKNKTEEEKPSGEKPSGEKKQDDKQNKVDKANQTAKNAKIKNAVDKFIETFLRENEDEISKGPDVDAKKKLLLGSLKANKQFGHMDKKVQVYVMKTLGKKFNIPLKGDK